MQIVNKYRLYPTKDQEEILFSTLNFCRKLYNYMMDLRQRYYKNYKYSMSYTEQSRILTFLKKTDEWSFLKDIHSQVLQNVLKRLDIAYVRFFKGISGYPHFKSYRNYCSFTYPQVKTMKKPFSKEGFVLLPKIGYIKMNVHRRFNPEDISNITIKYLNGNWYIYLTCEVMELKKIDKPSNHDKQIGVDLGIKYFIALSDETFIEKPKHLYKSEARLKLLQRRLSRKIKGSNNREKARRKLAKLHEKIANQRKDFLHYISKKLADKYDLIVVEDLKIKNMVKNHKLAKSIHDASWGTFVDFLDYKMKLKGKILDRVNPNGTSQTCLCGAKVPKDLSVRTHECSNCGVKIDRDTMSAKVILSRSKFALV